MCPGVQSFWHRMTLKWKALVQKSVLQGVLESWVGIWWPIFPSRIWYINLIIIFGSSFWQSERCWVEQYWLEGSRSSTIIDTWEYRNCYNSVDGTDVLIDECSLFSSRWILHKLNGASLKYKVVVRMYIGHIVWTGGLFKVRDFNEIQIFRQNLRLELA